MISKETIVTSADKTFLQLRTDIVEGIIPAGSKLSETELSTKYAVSRAVIREAINRLTSCHLVERKANVGARVVALSPEGLIQLYQVREALEGMAAPVHIMYVRNNVHVCVCTYIRTVRTAAQAEAAAAAAAAFG